MIPRHPASEQARAAAGTLVLTVFLLAVGAAPASADPFEAARKKIREAVDDGKVPSIAVAVSRGSEIVWEEAFGYANREQNIAATPRTPYSLASISKPITATGLMILVERGQVGLDQPINRYLGKAKLRAGIGTPPGRRFAAWHRIRRGCRCTTISSRSMKRFDARLWRTPSGATASL